MDQAHQNIDPQLQLCWGPWRFAYYLFSRTVLVKTDNELNVLNNEIKIGQIARTLPHIV